ncbi:GNAT family N-acetyltransferase [Paenibacillus albus]|uniref:GNAT family N-acetyltransferase n=1 Tax=Paenibacillus albus TaxID=2495582 RepID=A0A3S9ADD0_9BACL|nr:GNAT family N-acetyltransferase [Paenibacillus albus]AZN43753.1 GNAT family N-acetyltransferase [Paenibacillus albus]
MNVVRNSSIQVLAPVSDDDKEWLRSLWITEWGGEDMVARGKRYVLQDVDAVIAWADGVRVGAATYRIGEHDGELTSLNSVAASQGIGSRLIAEVEEKIKQSGLHRICVITTNDNMDALRFYQRRGYRISAVYLGFVDEARKQKPTIPHVGYYDIPIRDEIELEKIL